MTAPDDQSYQELQGMRALTIKQPWASLIMAGIKDVESRTWVTAYRGPLVIHAGASYDPKGATYGRELPQSALLGIVDLVAIEANHPSQWAYRGHQHWVLADPRPFAAPIPCKGSLGLWRVK
jgi:hypothetical protein